jgi:hypothetical protein
MNSQASYGLLALLWIVGVLGGLTLRYGGWAARQTPDASGFAAWWSARKGSNVSSIVLAMLTTGMWAEGSLYRTLHLEKIGLDLTYGVTPLAGAGVAFFAHYILAAGKRRAEAAAGGPVED